MEWVILKYKYVFSIIGGWAQVEGKLFVFQMFRSGFIHEGMDQTHVPTPKCIHIIYIQRLCLPLLKLIEVCASKVKLCTCP